MADGARQSTGWFHSYISHRPPVQLKTSAPVDDEVFAAIEYVSEIPSVGHSFLKSAGVPRPKAAFESFRAFIRQGKAFYEAASHLHYRAAPLMYYYAFLNLAKAYITTREPTFVRGPVQHGLGQTSSSKKLVHETIRVPVTPGVFHKLYEIETHQPLRVPIRLNVATLLGYCTDVGYEYGRAGYGASRLLPVKARFLSHQASRITWPALAFLGYEELKPFKKALRPFHNYFQVAKPASHLMRDTFGIFAEERPHYTFVESKITYPWAEDGTVDLSQIRRDVLSACASLHESPIYDDGFDFSLALPLRRNLQIPFNQPLAVYAAMFYVGSLVRYRPAYLERTLQSKDAWMIERFVRGAPTTFLRYIGNAILGTDYLYGAR